MRSIYPFSHIYHAIYLLQLENYNITRFIRVAARDALKFKTQERKEIEWTKNLLITSILGGILAVALGVLDISTTEILFDLNFLEHILLLVIEFLVLCHVFFVPLSLAVLILKPLEKIRTEILVKKAKAKIASRSDLKVVAIAGSYGKTTMKETVTALFSESFPTLASTGNENTAIGVSRLILSKLKPEHKVLILEMGEYVPGDIRDLCEIAPPDISIVTGINEAHLERMKTIDRTISTIFEVALFSKENATILLNADDERVRDHAPRFIGGRRHVWFGSKEESEFRVTEKEFNEEKLSILYDVKEGDTPIAAVELSLLGGYMKGVIAGAFSLGKIFSIEPEKTKAALETLRPVEHRLEPRIESDGTLLIDDSYNGNPDGFLEALSVLSRFTTKRKIFVTPGLVELGKKSDSIHRFLGKKVAEVADLVVLIRTSASVMIKAGLVEAGFSEDSILEFSSMPEALSSMQFERKKGDVMLIQNDWPDNYR